MVTLPEIFDAAAHQAMSNFDLALDLARQGLNVFPCQPDGADEKKPCPGIFWRSVSTSNESKIRQWWDRWPDAMPGLDLAKAGIVVIDCDRKPGQPDGVAAFLALASRHDDALEGVPIVATANGGEHYYFRQWSDHGNGKGNLPNGIDVRGNGGYVIAPGATFIDGRRYEPTEGHFLDAKPAPQWLVDILDTQKDRGSAVPLSTETAPPISDDRKRIYGEAALDEEISKLATCGSGGRNNALNEAAFALGQLVAGGCLNEVDVRRALVGAAQGCGLLKDDGHRAVQATIASGLRAGARDPRGPPEDPAHVIMLGAREIIEAPDGTRADAETGEIIEDAPADDGELPDDLTRIPGLLGEITDWICDTSRRPQRGLALGAALTVLGTAAGRHLAGPTGSGTHLYVIGLAPTGSGKDHALQQIGTLLAAARMQPHIGPSQFISMPAVINFLVRSPLSVCAMDEFGSFLKRINSRKASGFESAIGGILRTAWGTSFRPLTTPEWAGKQSETILAPAMSIYGASTAEEFYGALEGGDTSNGVLNRLLIIETRQRPTERDPIADPLKVPDRIIAGIKAIYERQGPLVAGQLNRYDMRPDIHAMPWGPGAREVYRDLVEQIQTRCDGDVQAQAYFARTAEMAVRLASIRAAGINPQKPVVSREDMAWAAGVALWSAGAMQGGATDHISDSDNQSSANLVRRSIREFGGRVKHRDLLRKLNHRIKDRDLKELIKSLAEAEQIRIEKVVPQNGGTPSVWYSLDDTKVSDNRT